MENDDETTTSFSNFSAGVEWMTRVSTSILFDFMYLSIEWEGTGKYLARREREPNIFPSGPPTQSKSTIVFAVHCNY